jgi:hypothetical protein
MRAFIDQDPARLDHATILAWLTAPGRLGDLALGAPTDGEQEWFGSEDSPQPVLDGSPDRWIELANHHGCAEGRDGKLSQLSYGLAVWTPDRMFGFAEEPPRLQLNELRADVTNALTERLGKPIRRTKNATMFAWDGGELELSGGSESVGIGWVVARLALRAWGSSPLVGLVTSGPDRDAGRSTVERPDPAALKDSLSYVLPDSFGCGMKVTTVEVVGEAVPYNLTIGIRFDPYTGEDIEERFKLTVDDPAFDIESAAIEAMSEILGQHM